MATQLKDIQFTSPVMQGTTSGSSTTWTVASTDTLSVCGTESHYGCEYHSGNVVHNGCEYHYGNEYHCSCEYHVGSEYHCGYENHDGCEYHSGCEYHYGDESHSGFAFFSANCGCGDYAGAGIAVSNGIAFQGGSGQVILLNYTTLSQHGF